MTPSAPSPVFTRTALAIAISLASAHLHAADLPTGGNIVGGSGSLRQEGNSLDVQQNSDRLITHWDSFDIGAGHTVNFHQPGSDSVALNRVIGEDASAIYGNLNANGQVFLINPNGVLFGQGAAVNVGALVASTLSLSDEDFNNGHYQFSGDGNNAAVVNHGTLNADGGAVALLGGQVSNHGIIQANQGTVALAAGDQITLDFAGDGLLNVTVDEGTLNALVENHQLVRANGGQVIMTANATDALLQTVVNNTGVIEAQTLDNQSGTIVLRGGFNGGTVNVAGTLDASAPDSGDGGFIDTSGAHVKIAGGTQVTTKANSGTTGEWLIDPTDFTISAGSAAQTASGIGAATLSANLENNNVTLETVDTGSEAGDMYVNGAVSWDANTTLSLDAHNDIHINQAITATGTNAGLVLNTGAGKDYAIASDAAITLSGSNAALNINGTDYTLIHDMAALDAIDTTGLGGAYALAINLDASGTTYDHALVGVDDTNAFTGTFAGLGHTISNLTINKTVEAKEYIGLFGVNNGLIRDIGLEGGSVSVFGNGDKYGGALAGYNDTSGIIVNVTATGNVNVNAYGSISYGGGLVGHNQGTITHATASGEVRTDGSGRGYSGGLVAINKGTITHATASGTVVNQNSSIRGRYAGGLVAVNDAGTITHATATGNVSSASGAEGYMGGLVGLNNSGNITYTHATGNVSVISSNNGYAGGLVGANNSGTITHSYATGNVSASVTGSTPYAGGLVGHNTGTVTYTYATGNVSGSSTGNLWFGGLVGHNQGDISYAYASGDTTTNGSGSGSYTLFLGGLVGLNQSSGTIDNAYATGTAKATNSAGTLAIGGFSGRSDGTITASYWDTETSGLSAGGAASGTTGLTTEQMLQADSFTGWDIDAQGGTGTVWRIYEGHTAPLLRNFLTALEVTGDSTTTYNGTEQSGTWSATGEYDANHIFGQASGGGRNAGTYNIDMSGLYSDQQGYDLITTNGTLTINKAQATVTANSGTTTYNGTEQSVDGFTVDGLVNGEDQSVLTGVTTSGGKGTNAGSYVLTVSGGSADNYELSFVDGKLTINKAQATVTANSGTTTYNGTEQSISGFTVEGLVNGEDASVLNGITTSGGKGTNAGSYVLTVGGGTADNYELSFVDGKLTINKAQATVTANSGTTTYNGTEQSVDGFTVDGLVNGEDQSVLTGVTTSGGKGTNVGSYTLTASGTDGNYELAFVDGTLTINKAQATVTANSGTTTYNGTEQSVSGFTVDGLVNGEDASVLNGITTSGGTGTNAGTYVLTASGSGSDGNYALTFIDGALTIERKAIAADILAQDKPFDGTLTAVLEGVLNGAISGDDVELQLSGLFANLTPGENRVLVDASLTGADAGNYQLIIPDSVPANMQGFVQSAGYQSAMDSRPRSQVELDAPSDTDYQLDIDDDALSLPMVSR